MKNAVQPLKPNALDDVLSKYIYNGGSPEIWAEAVLEIERLRRTE
jgi:hypothetical protein